MTARRPGPTADLHGLGDALRVWDHLRGCRLPKRSIDIARECGIPDRQARRVLLRLERVGAVADIGKMGNEHGWVARPAADVMGSEE